MYLDEFETDDLVFFAGNTGVSINIDQKRLVLFWAIGREWSTETLALDILRGATEKVVSPSEFFSLGVSPIGETIGIAIRNSMEKSKAKNATGVELKLRSTDVPTFFLNVSEDTTRASVMEAFRQVLEEGGVVKPYRNISQAIRYEFKRPTVEELKRDAEKLKREEERRSPEYLKTRRKRNIKVGLVITSILVVGLIFLEINRVRDSNLRSAAARYMNAAINNPQMLSTADAELCRELQIGYDEILNREGVNVTHVIEHESDIRDIIGHYKPNVTGGYTRVFVKHIFVIISEAEGTFQLTRNAHTYSTAPHQNFGQSFPLPADMNIFHAIVEPTCG
ncbi:hypothetical protein [Terasakiella pusilla]|uniref:hypothetical protein n=1 Tax=Terasakiella pusilla TaxID=64973 RepID=UPI003AA8F2D6